MLKIHSNSFNEKEADDIKLKPGQWILKILWDKKKNIIVTREDESMIPAKNVEEKKTALDNSFTALCNACAQISAFIIQQGIKSREEVFQIIDGCIFGKFPELQPSMSTEDGQEKIISLGIKSDLSDLIILTIIWQPEVDKLAIYRYPEVNFKSAAPNEIRKAVSDDFSLIISATIGFIKNELVMKQGMEMSMLKNALWQIIDCYINIGTMNGGPRKINLTKVETEVLFEFTQVEEIEDGGGYSENDYRVVTSLHDIDVTSTNWINKAVLIDNIKVVVEEISRFDENNATVVKAGDKIRIKLKTQ